MACSVDQTLCVLGVSSVCSVFLLFAAIFTVIRCKHGNRHYTNAAIRSAIASMRISRQPGARIEGSS